MTKDFSYGNLRVDSSELRIYCWKVNGNVLLNVALTVGVFVECKLGVMYVGMNRNIIHDLCMSQDEINI